jgi:hypothetical protein
MTETLPATPPTWRLRLWTAVAWLPQWAVVLLAIVLLLAATAWGLLSPILRETRAIQRLNNYPGAAVYRKKSDPCFPPLPTRWERIIAGLTIGGQWSPDRFEAFFLEQTPTEALRELILLRRTDRVSLEGNQWNDGELAFAMQSLKINELVLTRTGITGDGWGVLQGQPIRELCIESGALTSQLPSVIQAIPQLEKLVLHDCKLPHMDLKPLSGHPKLSHISMQGVGVTSDCIEALATLPELTHLSLVDSQIDNGFLKELGRVRNLRSLSVAGSKITDAGLAAIPATVRLEFLSLANTDISEVGLLGMKRAPINLDLVGTRVRVTEPLYHWFITHKLDTISLDDSSLDPESKMAERLRIRIGQLAIADDSP